MKKLYTRRELLAILTGAGLSGRRAVSASSISPQESNTVVTARIGKSVKLGTDQFGLMLDRAIVQLTGARDASDAWTSLFSPNDYVSIKVNCIGGPAISTNPLLVAAVVARLILCGVKERRIIIWDRASRELKEAGYRLSMGGSDIQCYGTDKVGYRNTLYEHGSVASLFSRIHTDRCTKIINMPILKDHGICGVTFALKNYFGAIHNPNKFHLNRCDPYIGELNAMKIIREKESLIVGDMTRIQADGGPGYKSQWAINYNGIMIGRDPVAVDSAGLEILRNVRKDLGRPTLEAKGLKPDYIDTAAEMGVGNRIQGKELIELSI